MKSIIFLLGSYYPNYSAVGYCIHQVIACLKEEFEITVIAQKNEPFLDLDEYHEGVRILRAENKDLLYRNKYKLQRTRLNRTFLYLLRLRSFFKRVLSPETVDRTLVNAYLDVLNKVTINNHIIVPVVFPIETCLAAFKYNSHNQETQIVPYIFDDFVDSGSLHGFRIASKIKRMRHLDLEKKILEKSLVLLCMNQLKDHFKTNFSNVLFNKIKFLEHPLLVNRNATEVPKEQNSIQLCFTGSLIRNVREPKYLLKILRKLNLNSNVCAHFYVTGNAAKQIKNHSSETLVQIINHGWVPKETANLAIQLADILINMGEKTGRQVSSKIFEYMSTGKPIIHISFVSNDSVSTLLSKYPLALILLADTKSIFENIRATEAFILKNKDRRLDFNYIKSLFPDALPEKTADAFRSIVS